MKKSCLFLTVCLLMLSSEALSLDQMPDTEMKNVSLQSGVLPTTKYGGEDSQLPDLLGDKNGETAKDLGIEVIETVYGIADGSERNNTRGMINMYQTLNQDMQAFDYTINQYFNTPPKSDVKAIRLQLSTDFSYYRDYFNK